MKCAYLELLVVLSHQTHWHQIGRLILYFCGMMAALECGVFKVSCCVVQSLGKYTLDESLCFVCES